MKYNAFSSSHLSFDSISFRSCIMEGLLVKSLFKFDYIKMSFINRAFERYESINKIPDN